MALSTPSLNNLNDIFNNYHTSGRQAILNIPPPPAPIPSVKSIPGVTTPASGFLNKTETYGRGLITSPGTTLSRILTGQGVSRVDNGAIISPRMPYAQSTKIKQQLKAGPNTNLDHFIPLEIGGTNQQKNLRVVPAAQNAADAQNVENVLGNALKLNKIDAKTAQNLATQYKTGKLSPQQLQQALAKATPPRPGGLKNDLIAPFKSTNPPKPVTGPQTFNDPAGNFKLPAKPGAPNLAATGPPGQTPGPIKFIGNQVTSVAKAGKTLVSPEIDVAKLAAASVSHNPKASQNAQAALDKLTPHAVVGAGLQIGSLLVPETRLAKGLGTVGSKGLGAAVTRAGLAGAKLAPTGAAYGAGSAISAGAKPKDIAKSAGQGAALTGGLGLGGSLLGSAVGKALAAKQAGRPSPPSALDTHIEVAEKAQPTQGAKPNVPEGTVTYTSKTKGDIPVDSMSPTHAKNALTQVQKAGNSDPALVKALTERAALNPPKIPTEPVRVNPVTATLGSKQTVLRKINTPSAIKAADAMRQADLTSAKLRTKLTNMAPTFRSLKGNDMQTAWQLAEGKAESSDPTIKQAANEARQVMDSVEKARIASGREAGHIPNYMPHEYDWKSIKKNPDQYGAALNAMVKSGAAKDLADAAGKFNYLAKPGNLQKTSFSHFDLQRGIDIPGYKMNRDVFDRYVGGASQDIANSTHFGAKNEVTNKLLAGIVKEGGDAGLAKEAIQNYLHAPQSNSRILKGGRTFFGAARLAKAAISHAGQTSNVGLAARLSDLGSGWAKRFGDEGQAFVDKSGVNHPDVIHGYQDQYTGLSGTASKVTAPLLKGMMKVNRGVAALAGRRYGNFLASKGDAASLDELKRLGVSGKIGKTLTADQEFEAARGMADKTMFNPTRSSTPIKAETSVGKTVGQYRAAYVYKQTGLIYNQVLKEAAKGNLKPLAKFVALSAPVAAGTIAIKNKFSGNAEGPGGIAMDAAGGLLGLPGEIALQAARYAKGNILKTAAGTVAPMAGEAVDVGQRAQDLVKDKYGKHNPKPLEQYGAGLVPGIGPRLGRAINPPTPTNQTLNSNPDIQKELKGINYSIASPGQKQRGVQLSPDQYKQFVNQSNALFIQKSQSAIADPSYQSLSAAEKKKTMSAQLSASRSQVLDKLVGKGVKTSRFKAKNY